VLPGTPMLTMTDPGGMAAAPPVHLFSAAHYLLLGGIDANGDFRSSSDRPGTAGRNTGKGEPFYNVDMRLARRFFASESRYLEFTFEAFNVFNHTNFIGINNEVGTTIPPTGPFDLRGIEGRAPTQPLGFTSAAPARQL
jgi:hypothetical protein